MDNNTEDRLKEAWDREATAIRQRHYDEMAGTIVLSCRRPDGPTIEVEVSDESYLEDLCEALRVFVIAVGYDPESVKKWLPEEPRDDRQTTVSFSP